MFKESTAEELAGMLESMSSYPHNTGGLSMLDEATMAFGRRDGGVREAQQAFSISRHQHMRSYRTETGGYSDEAWEKAMGAARELAVLLRPLGGTRIARCGRKVGWGTCGLPLDDDGVCRSSLGHTDEKEN